MKLSTGRVAFPIEFDNGDKATIWFNPNDREILERIRNFSASIEKRVKEVDFEKYKNRFGDDASFTVDLDHPEALLDMPADKLIELQNRLDVVNAIEREYNDAVKAELDVVFDSKVSDVVFKYCQPFDVVVVESENGEKERELYVMQFTRWLMAELKKLGGENKSAIDKHLAKYST